MEQSSPLYYLIRLDPPPRIHVVGRKRASHLRGLKMGLEPPYMEISFLQEGAVREWRNGEEITHGEGAVLTRFIGAAEQDRIIGTPAVSFFVLQFRLDDPPLPLTDEEVDPWSSSADHAIVPRSVDNPAAREQIGTLLKSASRLVRTRDPVCHLKLRSILHECLAILSEEAAVQAWEQTRHTAQVCSPYTKKAQEYIYDNLSRQLTVAEVVAHVGISYEHLHRCFRRDMNMTLTEYMNRARIRQVEHCITAEGLTMKEAGKRVGIRDDKYLSRLFHRYVGISASQYRRFYQERLQL